jgi:hypothetical protein
MNDVKIVGGKEVTNTDEAKLFLNFVERKEVGVWLVPKANFYFPTYEKPNWVCRRFMEIVGWKWKEQPR